MRWSAENKVELLRVDEGVSAKLRPSSGSQASQGPRQRAPLLSTACASFAAAWCVKSWAARGIVENVAGDIKLSRPDCK